MLNDIQIKSPKFYQRYHVDLLLEEWHSALNNIAELADDEQMFKECLSHIKKHKLFSLALVKFCNKPQYQVCFYYFF